MKKKTTPSKGPSNKPKSGGNKTTKSAQADGPKKSNNVKVYDRPKPTPMNPDRLVAKKRAQAKSEEEAPALPKGGAKQGTIARKSGAKPPFRAPKPKPETAEPSGPPRTFAVYKPYGMLCQFTKENPNDVTLAALEFEFPKDAYPIGRLDKDSEGLLLISTDKRLTEELLNPANGHKRTYWVQVEKIPTSESLKQLREGVDIRVDGKNHRTSHAIVHLLPEAPTLPERNPPIRFRASIPTAWLEITLTEGKNRQVRHMTAAIGHPTLRLVRTKIDKIGLAQLKPGEVREL